MEILPRIAGALGASAILLVSSIASTQPPGPEAHRDQLEGRWRLVGSPSRSAATRDAAVERVVQQMAFFVRPIARSRLRDGSPIDPVIELRFTADGALRVRFGERSRYTTTIGRTEQRRRADGTPIRVTQRFGEDGALEQVFQTDSGARYFIYRPGPDGSLRVEIITTSDRLPAPVRFTLTYRR